MSLTITGLYILLSHGSHYYNMLFLGKAAHIAPRRRPNQAPSRGRTDQSSRKQSVLVFHLHKRISKNVFEEIYILQRSDGP